MCIKKKVLLVYFFLTQPGGAPPSLSYSIETAVRWANLVESEYIHVWPLRPSCLKNHPVLSFWVFFFFFNSSSLLIAFPIPVLGLYGNWFYLGQFKFGAATWMGWIWMETTQMSALWTAIQVSNQSNHNLNWSTWAWVGVDCFDFGCYLVILLCILYLWTSVLIGKIIGTQCNLNCSSTPYDMF